ncbi:MAG: PAS domain-containing protein [Alphaproteobacteria bacterium]|nr:PAS domain-containing protein [Alphaproteobacteria bacterium]
MGSFLDAARALRRWPLWARWGAAAVLVMTAMLLRHLLTTPGYRGDVPLLLMCMPVVVICAAVFDRGTGLVAVVLGAVAAIVGYGGAVPELEVRAAAVRLAVFIGTGVLVAGIVEALRSALDAALARGTALERDRAILTGLLQATPDPIYVKDVARRGVVANLATIRVLGVPLNDFAGRDNFSLLPPDIATAIDAVDRRVLEERHAVIEEERIRLPSGEDRLFVSTKAPWLSETGELLGLIGISRDVTAARRAEDALRAADAQKAVLLADLNHRVKNHLQSVSGLLDLASRRAETLDEARAALEAGARRLGVLGRVYTRLQIDRDKTVVEAQRFLGDLCEDLRASLVGERPVAVHVDSEALDIDSSRAALVGLIVNELVQNALKYAFPDDRAGSVRVGFARSPDEFRLTVADDGIGFAGDATAGSGKRLVRALVQQLGGTLDRQGPPGTRYDIGFPAEDPALRP